MKNIDVKDQPKLSPHRTFEICLNGIRYRLFRSTVTMIVIAVAIAFMMNTLTEGVSKRAVSLAAEQGIREQHAATRWVGRLTLVNTTEEILRDAARTPVGDPLLTEMQQMGKLQPAQMDSFRQFAVAAVPYLDYFAGLNYGNRRLLVSDAAGVDIFTRLAPGAELKTAFDQQLATLKSVRLPDAAQFDQLLQQWNSGDMPVKTMTEQIQHGYSDAIATLQTSLIGKTISAELVNADGAFGDTVRSVGFTSFTPAMGQSVARQARQMQDEQRVDDSTTNGGMRSSIAADINKQPGEIKTAEVWSLLRSRSFASWYLGSMRTLKLDTAGLTPESLQELARTKAEQETNENAIRICTDVSGGFMGLGSRMTWLVLVSLLVCVVGISNAMLMSVTERFREIATLKCLGALDGFIMSLFVMEACLLGLVGGGIGAVIGSIIGFGRMSLTFGSVLWGAFPVLSWVEALGFSLIVGMVLAALAGVYPSYIAARLAPMEAMRIE